jgi:hypothetical protein
VDPVRALDSAFLVARAIDEELISRIGFGLSDALEVILRHADAVVQVLAPLWPTDAGGRDRPEPEGEALLERIQRIAESPCVVSDDEIAAVERSFGGDYSPPLSGCLSQERAALAHQWLTCTADEIDVDRSTGQLGPRPFVTVNGADGWHSVPAALSLDMAMRAVGALSAHVASDVADARLSTLVRMRSTDLLGFRHNDELSPGEALPERAFAEAVVVVRGRRHAVIVEMLACLDRSRLEQDLRAAAEQAASVSGVEISRRTGRCQPDAEVLPVIIYGGPFMQPGWVTLGVPRLHLSELDAIVSDAFEQGDLDLLWQFLEELSDSPPFGPETDVLDAWRHWLHLGCFDPSCTPGASVLVDPVPDETAWQWSSRIEPVRAVLADAGLDDSTSTRFAVLDDDGAEVVVEGYPSLVSVQPPLVLFAEPHPHDAAPELWGDISSMVASGIRSSLRDTPSMRRILATSGRTILGQIGVDLDAEQLDAAMAIGVAYDARSRAFGLQLRSAWLQLLIDNASAAHGELGLALAAIARELSRDSTELSEADLRLAISEWNAAPPVVILQPRVRAFAQPPDRTRVPRGRSSRYRAQARIAKEVRRAGIAPGTRVGEHARQFCGEVLTPALEAALRRTTARWSRDAVMPALAALNRAHADRSAELQQIEMGLQAPWAAKVHQTVIESNDSALVRPLELLVEWLLANPPSGDLLPDVFDLAPAVSISETMLTAGVLRRGMDIGMHSAAVAIGPGGTVSCRAWTAEQGIDLEGFVQALHQHANRMGGRPLGEAAPSLEDLSVESEAKFESLADIELPGSLLTIENLLKHHLGTGTEGLVAVLATAQSLATDDAGLVRTTRAALIDSAHSWSGLDRNEIEAAVDQLTLSTAGLREEFDYWEMERRAQRVMTRPLIEWDAELVTAPAQARSVQLVLAGMFLDGRLPWPPFTLPGAVNDALAKYRQRGAEALESEVSRIVHALGLPHVSNLDEVHARSAGLLIPGEIDLLVLDDHTRLWVCEVKDLAQALSPSAIRSRIQRYLGSKGFARKLDRKVKAVSSDLPAVCSLLGVEQPPLEIHGLFVTRTVEPYAFSGEARHLFALVDDLPAVLSDNALSGYGQYPVGPSMLSI